MKRWGAVLSRPGRDGLGRRSTRSRETVSAGVLVLFVAFSVTSSVAAAEAQSSARQPLELAAESLGHGRVSLLELRGDPVLLQFWATWCAVCRANLPRLQEIHSRYRDRVRFVGISFDRDPDRLRDVLRRERIVWPQVCDSKGLASPLLERFGIEETPTYVLLDRQGREKMRGNSLEAVEEWLERLLAGS